MFDGDCECDRKQKSFYPHIVQYLISFKLLRSLLVLHHLFEAQRKVRKSDKRNIAWYVFLCSKTFPSLSRLQHISSIIIKLYFPAIIAIHFSCLQLLLVFLSKNSAFVFMTTFDNSCYREKWEEREDKARHKVHILDLEGRRNHFFCWCC